MKFDLHNSKIVQINGSPANQSIAQYTGFACLAA